MAFAGVRSQKPNASSEKPKGRSRKKSQMPKARSRKPEAKSQEPNARSRKPEARSQKPEAKASQKKKNAKKKMPKKIPLLIYLRFSITCSSHPQIDGKVNSLYSLDGGDLLDLLNCQIDGKAKYYSFDGDLLFHLYGDDYLLVI